MLDVAAVRHLLAAMVMAIRLTITSPIPRLPVMPKLSNTMRTMIMVLLRMPVTAQTDAGRIRKLLTPWSMPSAWVQLRLHSSGPA